MANYETLPGAIANGDMSTMQFGFVNLSGSTSVDFEIQQSTAPTARPVGILMNAPTSSGQPAEVAMSGVAQLRFDARIAQGQTLVCSSGGKGKADTTTADEFTSAVALQNGTASGIYFVQMFSPPYKKNTT